MNNRRVKVSDGAAVYHCIGRIVGGSMLLGNAEKERLRTLMWRLAEFSGIEIITYCLMTNHIHVLVRVAPVTSVSDNEIYRRITRYYGTREPWVQLAGEELKKHGRLPAGIRDRMVACMGDVSMFMRTLKRRFTLWYNRRHKRFGTLWAERFKSVLVEDSSDALRTVAMYIDLNPVRAGLVDDPKEYRFCGHAEAVAGNKSIRQQISRMCESSGWRKVSGEYRSIMMVYAGGADSPKKRAIDREKVLAVLKSGGRVGLAEVLRLRIRYLSDGVVFGSQAFVEEMFGRFRDRFGKQRISGSRKLLVPGEGLAKFATLRDLRKDAVS